MIKRDIGEFVRGWFIGNFEPALLKTDQFENIWWRIENRANQLAQENKLDTYHVTNILRAFSHGQHNQMVGQEKTFTNLEPIV